MLPNEGAAAKDLGFANLAQSLLSIGAPEPSAPSATPGLFLGGTIFGILGAVRVRKVR